MSILTALPKNILWDHMIVSMLSVRDLVLLDIAVTNHSIREKLKIFQNINWNSTQHIELNSAALHWLCHRNIGISSLSFTPNFMKVFNTIKSSLSSFVIATSPRISGVDAMMLRTSIIFLKSLEVSPDMKAIKILKCGKSFGNSDQEKARLMKHLSIVCPNLCEFYLSECDDDIPNLIFDYFSSLSKIVIIKKRSRNNPITTSPSPTNVVGLIEDQKSMKVYENVKTIEIDSINSSLALKICSCPNLTKLVIATNELTDSMIESILQSCHYLSDLRIESNVSDEMCRSIAAYGRHLKDLHLLSNRNLSPTLGSLLSPVIQGLSWFIWHSVSIEDGAIQALLPSTCHNIKTFQIGRGNSPNVQISVHDLKIMTKAFPNLTAMFIPCCLSPGNDALMSIATIKLPLLGLVIHVDGIVSGMAMTSLLTSCSNLQTVEMHTSELSSEAMLSITKYGIHLRDLILHSSHSYPNLDNMNNGMMMVSSSSSSFSSSSPCLSSSSPSCSISSPYPLLLTSQPWSEIKSLVKLRSLEICGPGSLDIRSLAIFINSFGSVNELKLNNVPFRDDVSAGLIPFHVSSVKLEHIETLTDFTLMRLGSCTLNLKQLRIRNCHRVTSVSVGTIAGMLNLSLKSILYYDCDMISDSVTAELSKIFPHMKIGQRLDID